MGKKKLQERFQISPGFLLAKNLDFDSFVEGGMRLWIIKCLLKRIWNKEMLNNPN